MNSNPFMRVVVPQNPLACLILIPFLILLAVILLPVIVIYIILLMFAGKRIPLHFTRPQDGGPSAKTDDDVIDVDVIHSETETAEKSHDSSGGKFLE